MKSIIVREYLESMKEDRELDALLPILLEVMGFQIISTPKTTKGYQQYGKDVVAVGIDESDGQRKRYYFEIKGGEDRNVTQSTYFKDDGIRMSILEAKDRPFKDSSHPEFNQLPVKIVLVHNGIIRENVRETFDGFIEQQFPGNNPQRKIGLGERLSRPFRERPATASYQFERWDIYRLTELFSEKLFNEYLLTDEASVQHFKKVLLLLNTPGNDQSDFKILMTRVFERAGEYTAMGKRERLLLSETLKLIAFILHSYAAEAGNLEPAKACLTNTLMAYWNWILINHVEKDREALKGFTNFLTTFRILWDDYFKRTLPVALLDDGLWSPKGGRFEQVGFPLRTMDYLASLIAYYELMHDFPQEGDPAIGERIANVVRFLYTNDSGLRPLLDIHSIPIVMTLKFFIRHDRKADAIAFLKRIWTALMTAYKAFGRLPEGGNSVKVVMEFVITNKKSVYYADTTSQLLGVLLEYTAVLDMEKEYADIQVFLKKINIDLAVFVPFGNAVLEAMPEMPVKEHELILFTHTLNREGYQSEIGYHQGFVDFKSGMLAKKEFSYHYRTEEAGFPSLISVAHVYFRTPFFPDGWRSDTVERTE